MTNIFKSSTGEGASMTMTGVASGLVTVMVVVARYFNLPITEMEITEIVINVGTVVASGTIIYGIARKVVNKLAK